LHQVVTVLVVVKMVASYIGQNTFGVKPQVLLLPYGYLSRLWLHPPAHIHTANLIHKLLVCSLEMGLILAPELNTCWEPAGNEFNTCSS